MFSILSLYVFIASSILILTLKCLDHKPPPIFGVYQRQSGIYWFKVIFIYVILSLRKLKNVLFPQSEEFYYQLDGPQKLGPSSKAVDAVYFNAANKNGDYLVIGMARRKNRLIDGFLYLKLGSLNLNFGLLEFPKLPDTSLFNTGNEDSYEAEGIKIIPIEPMKKWRLCYEGQLRERSNRAKLHEVKIDAVFTSSEPWYSYEAGMNSWSMAKVLSYEKWNRSYFKNVDQVHQLHYEQFGLLNAKIIIDNIDYNLTLDSLRDHTVGAYREWANFRRYAIHWVTAENGDHFSIGNICHPVTYSRMKIGYMYSAHDKKMYSITKSDLEIYQHGELGTPPKDYAFKFTVGNNEYIMQVNIVEDPHFYISKRWEAKVHECLCKIEVNGIPGHGFVEWQYRNVEGRNIAPNRDK